MKNALALVILALHIGGCTPWPETVPLDEEISAVAEASTNTDIDSDQLDEKFARLELELQVLVLDGAADCLPAHIISAEHTATRLHNELRVKLYRDVISDLAIFGRQIDDIRRRLEYLGEHTRCREPHVDVTAQLPENANKPIAEVKGWGSIPRRVSAPPR